MSKKRHRWGSKIPILGRIQQTCTQCGCVKISWKEDDKFYTNYMNHETTVNYRTAPDCIDNQLSFDLMTS